MNPAEVLLEDVVYCRVVPGDEVVGTIGVEGLRQVTDRFMGAVIVDDFGLDDPKSSLAMVAVDDSDLLMQPTAEIRRARDYFMVIFAVDDCDYRAKMSSLPIGPFNGREFVVLYDLRPNFESSDREAGEATRERLAAALTELSRALAG